jgi:hypothetical protein
MEDNGKDLKLETTFTNARSVFPLVAAGLAVAGIAVIVLSLTTGLGAWLLPMQDRYLSVLIPTAADGSEALALQTLQHEIRSKTLTIRGTVLNRTPYPIQNLQAVIDVKDRYTLPVVSVTVPVDPADLPADKSAVFESVIGMDKELGGFTVRFRLPEEGPFVPHRDERPDALPAQPK